VPNLGPFIVAGLSTGALYVLASVGLVILFRASGTVNLAQGAIGALSAIIAWYIANSGGANWVGWIAGVAAATLVSFGYGRLIAPRLATSDPVVRAIATLGLALILVGAIDYTFGERVRSLRLPTDAFGITILDVRVTYTRLITMGVAVVVTIGMLAFLNRTRVGLAMRALANRREISALLGVPILRVDSYAWAISGVIAGVTGILLANLTRMHPQFLTFLVIPAIAAAVAGRMQSLGIAVAGGLAIGVIEALGAPFPIVAPYRTLTPFLFAILALVWLQRHGAPLIGGGVGLGDVEQKSTSADPGNARRTLMLQVGAAIVAAVLVAILLPEIAGAYWLKILTASAIISLAALGTGIIYAQLGMVSLCQFALIGIGGWFMMRLWHLTHWPFEIPLLVGGVCAAVFGLIFGLPALRMRGLYLALTTLMIAGGFQVFITATDFPDGGKGVIGKVINAPRQYLERPSIAITDEAYFRYVMVALVLGYLLVLWHKQSRAGRAWAMIRRSEACAISAGVNITLYKVWAFALAGFLTGIGGGLLAGQLGTLDNRSFPAFDSILLFAVTVIAGAYSWIGPIIAGLLMRAVPGILNDFHINNNVATIVFGAGLLHALITAPHGVAGQLQDLYRTVRAKLIGPASRKPTPESQARERSA
jgi:branched-subunit amino acid ABC-type transport system permease component